MQNITADKKIRNIILGIISVFHENIIINGFKIPFYFSIAGNEKYLLDHFLKGETAEGMYNKVPRGGIDLQSFTIAQENLLSKSAYGVKPVINENGKQTYKEAKLISTPVELGIEMKIIVSDFNQALKVLGELATKFYKNTISYIHTDGVTIPLVIRLSEDLQFEKAVNFSWDVNEKLHIPLSFDVLSYIISFDRLTETQHGKGMQGGLINNIIINGGATVQNSDDDEYVVTNTVETINGGSKNTIKISINN